MGKLRPSPVARKKPAEDKLTGGMSLGVSRPLSSSFWGVALAVAQTTVLEDIAEDL